MKRMLVIAHRTELIEQAKQHAKNVGLSVGIEMGNERAGRQTVVVSTVQTLNASGKCWPCLGAECPTCGGTGKRKRMQKFDPSEFGLVITDEAHHATAKSYRNVYKHFRQNPDLKLLKVTATPQRTDGVGMHNVVDSVAYRKDMGDLIREGWLCKPRQRFIQVEGLDLRNVATKAGGDFADGALERAFLGETTEEEERKLHEVARTTLEEAKGQPTLVFSPGCDHAVKLTACFNSYAGVRAECVLGSTDKNERREIMHRYRTGKTQVLVNVMVATEGFDAPWTRVVSVCRPTKSLTVYTQQIGRGTRTLPGVVDGIDTAEERKAAIAASDKPYCVILDYVGNSGRHKLISVMDVLAGETIHDSDRKTAINKAKKSAEPVDIEELVEKAKQAREEREKRKAEERKRIVQSRHVADRVDYTATDVDLFSGGSFDSWTDSIPVTGPSPKQARLLKRYGFREEFIAGISRGQASALISKKQREMRGGSGPDFVVTFGKHAGKKLKDIPRGYREYMANVPNATGAMAEAQRHIQQMEGVIA